MVCEVNYNTPAGLSQSFRKFFKFLVVKPLDVKTKFYNAETDEVYLEAQIQNITAGPICLEKVELESSDNYNGKCISMLWFLDYFFNNLFLITVISLNNLSNGESVFSSKNMLQTMNSCQFLYRIKPKPEIANDPKALKLANNIGKLDIVWRSNLGERGRLQTSQLQRSVRPFCNLAFIDIFNIICSSIPQPIEYGDLRLAVIESNSTVKIGESFNFTCRVTNTSERTMDLMMNLNTKVKLGCSYTGSTEYSVNIFSSTFPFFDDPIFIFFQIGVIESCKYKDFSLTVCPVKLGLITISDLQLTDSFLKRTYEFEDFVQVYVVDSDTYDDCNEGSKHEFNLDKYVRYNSSQNV